MIEFHFVVVNSFIENSNLRSLNELFNLIKSANFFVCLHESDFAHLHIITEETEVTKSAKIQRLVRKLKSKVPSLSVPQSSKLLKVLNTKISETQRERIALSLLSEGKNNLSANCLSRGNSFSSFCRQISSISAPTTTTTPTTNCLESFDSNQQGIAGIKMQLPDNEDSIEEGDSRGGQLTKAQKWSLIEQDIINTNSMTIKEFFMRIHPSRFKYYFTKVLYNCAFVYACMIKCLHIDVCVSVHVCVYMRVCPQGFTDRQTDIQTDRQTDR